MRGLIQKIMLPSGPTAIILVYLQLLQISICLTEEDHCAGFTNISASQVTGEIVSHSTVTLSGHQNNAHCYWQINSPSGKRVLAWFAFIDLEPGFDSVTLFDGAQTSASVIEKFSQEHQSAYLSPKFVSTASSLTVYFLSDMSVNLKGFRLHYKVTESPTKRQCSEIRFATSPNYNFGLLLSHEEYDLTPYPSDARCVWNLSGMVGKYVTLSIADLSLASGDCLTIRSNSPISSQEQPFAIYCGWTALAASQLSMTGNVTIRFVSDGNLESSGFSIGFAYQHICDGVQSSTDQEGTIVSHDGANVTDYLNNMRCSWIVTVTEGNVINAWFTFVSLESDQDSITIFDGLNRVLATVRGSQSPNETVETLKRRFSTGSNILKVAFSTDGKGTALGFKLKYKATDFYCHRFTNVTAGKGEIVSHMRVGNTRYPSNTRCYWQINAPVGRRVMVWFSYMDLETGVDSVTLFDGTNGSAAIDSIGSCDGQFDGPEYVSTANAMTVYFRTGARMRSHTGFRLSYSVVESSTSKACGSMQFASSSNGSIQSHATYGSKPYSPNASCVWLIREIAGHYIVLTVANISLGKGDCLKLTSQSDSSSSSNASYCGWKPYANGTARPFVFAGAVRVAFNSDSRLESTGFLIRFRYEKHCHGTKSFHSIPSGQLVSHDGVGKTQYLNGMNCSWTIIAKTGGHVTLWFTYLSLYAVNDTVTLHDAWLTNIATVRGSGRTSSSFRRNIYTTSSNILTVRFTTDRWDTALGFKLEFNTVESFCQGSQSLTGQSGEIASHSGAGHTRFPNNMLSCTWQITAPPGSIVIAKFTYFGLLSNSDRVILQDNVNRLRHNLLGVVQGGQQSRGENVSVTVYSTLSNIMVVKLITDVQSGAFTFGEKEGKGFRMLYWTTDKYCKGYKQLSEDNGTIVSHYKSGVNQYLRDTRCIWLVTAPTGNRVMVQLEFVSFGLYDGLILYDGLSMDAGNILFSLTGAAASTATSEESRSSTQTSSSNVMTVYFYTGSRMYPQSLGFRLAYNTTEGFCRKYQLVRSEIGHLESHSGVGAKPYLNNMNCVWQIQSAAALPTHSNKTISARFSYLNLASYWDSVTLLDGGTGIVIATVRGGYGSGYISPVFQSTSDSLMVQFTTDCCGTGLGFRLQYSVAAMAYPEASHQRSIRNATSAKPAAIAATTIGTPVALTISLLPACLAIILSFKFYRRYKRQRLLTAEDYVENPVNLSITEIRN